MASYKTGTVTVTNGSPDVVGVGTTWGAAAVQAGSIFSLVDANGAAVSPHYEVAEVVDDTHLKLTGSYGGATTAGERYMIWNLTGILTYAYLHAQVSALIQKYKNALIEALSYVTRSEDAATQAETARDGAQAAYQTAVSASDTAMQAKNEAIEAKNDAVAAQTGAETAKDGAEAAEAGAEAAKTAAQTSATNAANSASAAASSAAQVPIASLLPAAGQVPKAGADGKIDLGWLPAGATQRTHLFINGETDAQILAATKDGDIIDRLEEV